MQIDDIKFAAIVRHFGTKFMEGDDECYELRFPLQDVLDTPDDVKILPADLPSWHNKGKPHTVGFVTIAPKRK